VKTLRPYQNDAIKECWDALKKNDDPVLLMASVGAGKSLMLAHILLKIMKAGKRALCLVNNAELVRNNHATFQSEGGIASIYCAALGTKDCSSGIIFGTPQTILNGVKNGEPISKIVFNLVVVDEAHAINYANDSNLFMRILRHYKHQYQHMRLLGATGTNFRFKGSEIVGDNALFKSQVGNITTEQLINQGFLVRPSFSVDPNLVLDFSSVRIKQNGLFDSKQLEDVVTKSARLTELICKQVVHIMESQGRRGVFFFATTKKHAYEIFSHLPPDQSAIILGETPQDERTEILEKARTGCIKYLVNIAIISVGVDVPSYDTIAYLRPTESLVLLVQTMGRVLRLSPDTGKSEALVLDFSANIDRHRDWDNPILEDAVAQTIDKDKPLVILCPCCQTMNTEHARRCVGVPDDKRCDYYFEFKPCTNQKCQEQNDISSRHCRACGQELIDPNEKLSLAPVQVEKKEMTVVDAIFSIRDTIKGFSVLVEYNCRDNRGHRRLVTESYSPISEKAKNMFYGQFVKKHCANPGEWYRHLDDKQKVIEMLKKVNTPFFLTVINDQDKGFRIQGKHFS
jgi:DNA repair protein RadD